MGQEEWGGESEGDGGNGDKTVEKVDARRDSESQRGRRRK